ncbi:MAG: RNA polymerase sigma factor [Verrucomicrobia bacterium]|nr:RNA polymerase sigma factor [Verrucomicrobiota bacterium]
MSTPSTPEPSPVADQARWFVEEVHPHDGQLKAYLRGSFPSVRDVDDVVQESYLRVWKAHAVRPILSAKAFLFKVARHIALDSVQGGRVSLEDHGGNLAALAVMPGSSDLAGSVEADERVHLLASALITLPPRCREIVMLRKLRGIPRRDVAGRLGISEKTVDEQLARGVRRLEQYVRLHGGESRRA